MTAIEVLLIILVLALLMLILLPVLTAASQKARRIGCVNNLKLIAISHRLFASPRTNSFTAVYPESGDNATPEANVLALFSALSGEFPSPKFLICPGDRSRVAALSFDSLARSNISYFINLEATLFQPTTLLGGDSNLTTNDTPVSPGTLVVSSNSSVAWTVSRHNGAGNVALTDGSVQQVDAAGMHEPFWQVATINKQLWVP
jgi:prepilin-type processing-associated H-X9-DG protein